MKFNTKKICDFSKYCENFNLKYSNKHNCKLMLIFYFITHLVKNIMKFYNETIDPQVFLQGRYIY